MLTTSKIESKVMIAGFKALSEPLRLKVLEFLQDGELCVCELQDRIDISQSKLSFHLKILKQAKLVRSRQEGRWVYYSLNLEQLLHLEQSLQHLRENAVIQTAAICSN